MSETRRLAWALLGVCGVALLAFATGAHAAPDIRRRTTFAQADGVTCTFAAGQAPRCSDGRPILTASATARPCEQQQGVWTDVPANTACVTWDGKVDTYGPNTTYLVNGNRPDLWTVDAQSSVSPLSSGYRLCHTEPATNSGIRQTISTPPAGPLTLACIMRPNTGSSATMGAASTVFGTLSLLGGPQWQVNSYSGTFSTGSGTVFVYPRPALEMACIDVAACWQTRTATPGRACWGTNAAGTTCDGERHTISTAGFPTTKGEVRITYQLGQACPAGSSCFIFDGRGAGDTANPPQFFINTSGVIHFAGWGLATVALGAAPAVGVDDSLVLRRTASGEVVIVRNGVEVFRGARSPFAWGADARLGYRFADLAGFLHLNGGISHLSWSNK